MNNHLETWLQGFLAGILTMMGIVMVGHVILERIKARKERQMLETYGKVLGMMPKPGESNAEFRVRIREWMRMPGHPDDDV